ncbi:hypothetical protein [Nocardia shimofusensis]|uniref:hypothetical protein n=1 Tax=Nocardia shimofusensis TaxID=228596 RepID=UPI00082D8352|nr:hypothetical protein [Nocardia shimofusensis]
MRAALTGTSGFVAFWAFAGAVGLAGGGADPGSEVTARLPFRSPVFAGAALAALVGIPMTATAVLAGRSRSLAGPVGVGSGLLLTGWVTVQPFIIGRFHWLQPTFGALGLGTAVLARRVWNEDGPTWLDDVTPPVRYSR